MAIEIINGWSLWRKVRLWKNALIAAVLMWEWLQRVRLITALVMQMWVTWALAFLSDYIYFMPPLNMDGISDFIFLNTKYPSKQNVIGGAPLNRRKSSFTSPTFLLSLLEIGMRLSEVILYMWYYTSSKITFQWLSEDFFCWFKNSPTSFWSQGDGVRRFFPIDNHVPLSYNSLRNRWWNVKSQAIEPQT